jgi:hypothetical protein
MYFPAGIPIVAVIALVVWNAHLEKQRIQASQRSLEPKR